MTEIFDRESAIKDVLSRMDVPRSPFTYVHQQGIGPYDPDFFDVEHAERQKLEAKAEADLQAMTDDELWDWREKLGGLDGLVFRYELFDPSPWYAGGFGVEGYSPDYDHWAKMDFWSLEEAVCLSLGFKPEAVPFYHSAKNSPNPPLNFLIDRLALAKRAPFCKQKQYVEVLPRTFLKWARSKDLDLPAALINAVGLNEATRRPAMLNSVDKRKYDTALKVVLGLLAERHGEDLNSAKRDMKKEVTLGLEKLGLTLDPKTIGDTLAEALSSGERFANEQHQKDEKGD